MEAEELPFAPSNVATPKAGSVPKEKKKKLKAVYRKRHHGLGNLSIRNSTLNSTIFKASLKKNNRALAQALEKKKSEFRAAEAFILQQKEENQRLTTEVNKVKMIAEKTKRTIQERLRAVSSTLQLAVEQLVEAMDACTDGEFRKLSDPLLPATTFTSVSSSVNEQISLKPISNLVVHPAAGPSRVTVSAAAAACDDDKDQDVIASMDLSKEPPCDDPKLTVAPCENLSIIVEQSYLVPSEKDITFDEPELGFRHSNSRDRRNVVVFQPSMSDSPAPADHGTSKKEQDVRGRMRSRSKQSFDFSTGDLDMVQDAGIRRSSSRDRRNAVMFHPSLADGTDEDAIPAGICGRTLRRSRNPSGQLSEGCAAKTGRFEDSHAIVEPTKFKESVALLAKVSQIYGGEKDEEITFLDETLVQETELLSSELVGQLGLFVKNSKIKEGISTGDTSMEFIEETILIPYEQSSCVMEMESSQLSFKNGEQLPSNEASEGAPKCAVQGGEGLTKGQKLHGIQLEKYLPDVSLAEEAEVLVNRGQFATRDKIARTPVKVVKHFREGEEGSEKENASVHLHGDLSVISDRDLDESDYRRSRSLSRRDIPTFLPIDSSNTTGTTPGKSKGTVAAPKGPTKPSKSLKTTGKRPGGVGPSESGETKRKNNAGLIGCQDADAKSDVSAAGHSTENVRMARRGTFAVPSKNVLFLEADIMKEDDSVLINESFESCLGNENDVFINVEQLPKEGKDICSSKVESQNAENLNMPSQNPGSNATILMAEDMEQTGVSFAAISIIDPLTGSKQFANDETNSVGDGCRNSQSGNHSPEKQQVGLDKLTLGEKSSKVLLAASCTESVTGKMSGKSRKVNNKDLVQLDTACSKEAEARDRSADENVEHVTVKRRRMALSVPKVPGSGFSSVGKLSEKDAKSQPGVDAMKTGTVSGDPVRKLADSNRNKAEVESDAEENPERSMDVETKKKFAVYLLKPGNIVFNADRKDLAGNEVLKKTRSKSRSMLPLQQKPRSKAAANSAKPDDEDTPSVWDFKGTPRFAAAKENADRLLSIYDISLNDSGVIPKPKDEADPLQRLKKRSKALKEFSKDDSFIINKKPMAGKCRIRHESVSAIDGKRPFCSESKNIPKEALESPHGIMLVLGNGKRRKASARSKTVRYEVEGMGQSEADIDQGKASSLIYEISKDAAGSCLTLKKIDSQAEPNEVSKPKPPGTDTAATLESAKEPSSQQSGQEKIIDDKLTDDLMEDCVVEEAQRISEKDLDMELGKKVNGVSSSIKDVTNSENEEVTQRNQKNLETVRITDSAVSLNDKNAAGNVKASGAGKEKKNSKSAKGRGVVNSQKEITKDRTDSVKNYKSANSRDGTDFSPLCKDGVKSSNTEPSQVSVLPANDKRPVKQALESDSGAKSNAGSVSSADSSARCKLNALGLAIDDQRLASVPLRNAEQQHEAESPQEAAVQQRTRKRRVIRSTDLFEDIDTENLHSPKYKQPALAREEQQPVIPGGSTKARHKAYNQVNAVTSVHRQSGGELPQLPAAGNARRNNNSLRLRKNPKATITKSSERSSVSDVAEPSKADSPALVSEQPLSMAEKTADTKKPSSKKDSSSAAPHRRPNLSTKNTKEKTSQHNSNMPNEECIADGLSSDGLQADPSLVEACKDLDLQDDRSNENKSKKKHSVILDRQSSISTASCDTSSQSEMADRRTRRAAAQAVSYKEPSLGKKLRRGDPHTSTIYNRVNQELLNHHGSERTSGARLSRKVLLTVENTSMESE